MPRCGKKLQVPSDKSHRRGPWNTNIEPHLFTTGASHTAALLPLYMSFGHCWGSNAIPRLLLKKWKDYHIRKVVSDSPKTLQDAISITREMGIRYLWIDLLCITQDSEQDWLHESALMGDIYENSYCNISAISAKDGTMDCFYQRNSCLIKAPNIEASWSDLQPGFYYVIDGSMWTHEVDQAPLSQRAWVFQERFLTPEI